MPGRARSGRQGQGGVGERRRALPPLGGGAPMVMNATEALLAAARSFGLEFEDTTPPVDRYLDSNGLRMHYLDWGQAGKPPVLFLHGGGQTAHTWDFTCLQLRHRYHCHALDQRGHGDSDGIWNVGSDTAER